MTAADIYVPLTTIMRDLLMQDDLELSADLTPAQVEGWDSMMTISIIVAVESHFGIRLESQELESIDKVGDLVGVIQAHCAAR